MLARRKLNEHHRLDTAHRAPGDSPVSTAVTGLDVYQDKAGEWRWKYTAGNGDIVAESGEGYAEANKARAAFRRAEELMDDAEAEED